MRWLDALAAKAVDREPLSRQEALAVLASGDDELLDVVAAAFRVRLKYFGRRVKLNFLVNAKSGLCPEDCFYCSQRLGSDAGVLKYTWLKPAGMLAAAEAGVAAGAKRVCLTWRSAPAWACWPAARRSGCARQAPTPTTTT
jgi:biotin synthase